MRTGVWAGVHRVEGRVSWLVPRVCEARGRSPSVSESGRLCDPLHVWWGQSQERLCLSKLLLQVLPKPKYRQWVLGGKVRSWFILHRRTDAHTFLPSKFSEKSVHHPHGHPARGRKEDSNSVNSQGTDTQLRLRTRM